MQPRAHAQLAMLLLFVCVDAAEAEAGVNNDGVIIRIARNRTIVVHNERNRSKCGGHRVYNEGSKTEVVIQWARSAEEYESQLRAVSSYGVTPELVYAPGLHGRWNLIKRIVQQLKVNSILDVGGLNTYNRLVQRHKCINVMSVGGCIRYPGVKIPYATGSFDYVMAETVLHHAADATLPLLKEMVRVSSCYILVAEDILEHRASDDIFQSFRSHDSRAIYRSFKEWMTIASLLRLKPHGVYFLHRVPIHIYLKATVCDLGYAPMVYMVWKKARCRIATLSKRLTEEWRANRLKEERVAGLHGRSRSHVWADSSTFSDG